MTSKSYWDIHHFSIARPKGSGDENNVPALLRHVADSIEKLGDVEVQDVILSNEIASEGPWWSATVYFHFKDE